MVFPDLLGTKLSRSSHGEGLRSGGCEMTILSSIIVGLSSDYPRLSSNRLYIGGSTGGTFTWDLPLQDYVAGAVFGEAGGWLHLLRALEMTFHMWRRSWVTFIFRGRCSIWWGWRVALFAPRIGNDVSYVTHITDDIHFAWQAQYLVRLAGDFSWQVQHLVTFWEIAGPRNVVFFNTKLSRSSHGEGLRSGGCEMTILSSIIVGLSSDYHGLSSIIVESSLCWRKHWRHFHLRSSTSRLCGRRSIWWGWRVTLLVPRIGNDVSYVTQITDDIHFVWQAQYLVRLAGDFFDAAGFANVLAELRGLAK